MRRLTMARITSTLVAGILCPSVAMAGPAVHKASGGGTVDWPLARAPYLLETSLPGVFAVGDVRGGNIKRVASAVGEGSIAVAFVHQVLNQ